MVQDRVSRGPHYNYNKVGLNVAASSIKFNAQFQFQSQWRRLCVSGHFVYSFHYAAIVRVSLYLCMCVCAVTYWNQCGWLQSKTARHEQNRTELNRTEHDKERDRKTHSPSVSENAARGGCSWRPASSGAHRWCLCATGCSRMWAAGVVVSPPPPLSASSSPRPLCRGRKEDKKRD